MEETIQAGNYVIVQRQNYTKLYKMKEHSMITLGKDIIELDKALGHKYFENFRMVLKSEGKRTYCLEKSEKILPASQLNIEESGKDNRSIIDDGCSQTLSKEEIEKFRDEDLRSTDIVEKLITNSKSFKMKTEYSQEKYIKKKEKKYFEYIHFQKPSIRLLAQMFYRQEPSKVLGMRIDDLSQILTYANVQSEGNFLLYDSGTSGLVPAAVMNAIGRNTTGKLIHAHPGNECQKSAFLGMNFPKEQAERCINVNLYSVLRWFYQGGAESLNPIKNVNTEQNITNDVGEVSETQQCDKEDRENLMLNEAPLLGEHDKNTENDLEQTKDTEIQTEGSTSRKRTHDGEILGSIPAKRPCWHFDNEKACEILKNKVDSLIVVSKEHPETIVKELATFLKPSRPLVVFSIISEPLEELYFYLKKRTDFVNIKLTNNFFRNYQVLPERTHPEINMNFGGYLLSAFKLKH